MVNKKTAKADGGNLFKTARSTPVAAPQLPKGKKKEHDVLEMGDELTVMTAIDALIKPLETIANTLKKQVIQSGKDYMITEMLKTQRAPESLKATADHAEASIQMRKRSSNSPLNDEEVKQLKSLGLDVLEEKIVTEEIQEQFYFNPEISLTGSLGEKISKALESIPELRGKEIVLHQPARDKVVKWVVSDDAMAAAAQKLKGRDKLNDALKLLGTPAVRSKLDTQDLGEILKIIQTSGVLGTALGTPDEDEE